MTHPVLRLSRRFDFSAERVFDAWLDPAVASRWLFTTPESRIVRAQIDARVGGRFSLVDRRGDEEIEHVGEYLEIDRPRRLVFTFGVPAFEPGFTRVTIEIVPEDEGCRLTLIHEDVPEAWAEETSAGWGRLLDALEREAAPPAAS
jgi:uncharacterized protein YndB with AHSA1/START domain